MATESPTRSEDGTSTSTLNWGTAFQSPEFTSGLQSAIAQNLRAINVPIHPTPLDAIQPQETSQNQQGTSGVTEDPGSRRQSQGMFSAPAFVQTTGGAVTPCNLSAAIAQAEPHRDGHHAIPRDTLAGFNEDLSHGQNMPTGFEKAFILGPGRAPIPAKLVTQILSHQFIELSELIPENLEDPQAETTTFSIEGSTIVPKVISRKKREVSDILTWVECFNSYTAVMSTFFPTRARDLLTYMALIIRTAKRFGGRSWLNYDRAFRREATASNVQDWSLMKPDFYNYHTAAVNPQSAGIPLPFLSKQRGFRQEPGGIRHHTSSASRGTEARAPAKESGVVTVTPAPCPGAKPPIDESTTSSAQTPSANTHRIANFVHAELSPNKHCNDRPPPTIFVYSLLHVNLSFRYSHKYIIQFPDQRRLHGNTTNLIS